MYIFFSEAVKKMGHSEMCVGGGSLKQKHQMPSLRLSMLSCPSSVSLKRKKIINEYGLNSTETISCEVS